MKSLNRLLVTVVTCILITGVNIGSFAQDNSLELAKKLANPIAALISVPLQNNSDFGIGSLNGSRNTLNIQPVVPIGLSDNLNLITRVILPVIRQDNITGAGETQSGVADAVVSAFFSPTNSKYGITWGIGPVFLLPIGSKELSLDSFGAGPTFVGLRQSGGFTYGALINQIWADEFSQMFVQPFAIYNFPSAAGVGANFEITQNWTAKNTLVWFNPFVNALASLGKQKVQLGIGPRFNFAAPEGSKANWGIRSVVVFLFPK